MAVLSTCAVDQEVKAGKLRAVRVRDLHCDRDMFVVYDLRPVLPATARLFLLFLENHSIPIGHKRSL